MIENKILENNREFLQELEGLTLDEIEAISAEEQYPLSYNGLIEASLGLLSLKRGSDNYIQIDNDGDVYLHVNKFSLDLSGYRIEHSEHYEDVESAVNNIAVKWLREQLIKIHMGEWKYKEYADKLQSMVDSGFEISEIIAAGENKVRVWFKENELASSHFQIYFNWPLGCVLYLRGKLGVK